MTRRTRIRGSILVMLLCVMAAFVNSCEREARRYRDTAQTTIRSDETPLTTLAASGPRSDMNVDSPFHGNAYAIAEGKRLYSAFNCSGCHATAGGGAIGPALRDDKWIYGYSPSQIYATIVQGRPDGMPSFGGRIPEQQVWQLVAYIESLTAAQPRDAAPSRADDIQAAKPETGTERLTRRQTGHR